MRPSLFAPLCTWLKEPLANGFASMVYSVLAHILVMIPSGFPPPVSIVGWCLEITSEIGFDLGLALEQGLH
jgi:hypothetical protein